MIDVSAHGVDRRQRAEPRKYVRAANIPSWMMGSQPASAACALRPQQTMSIRKSRQWFASRPTNLQEEPRAPGAPFAPPPSTLFLPAGLGAVGRLMVIAGAEGPNWGRTPMLDIERREFITLLGSAAIFVYLLSRTFFPMAVRIYSSC